MNKLIIVAILLLLCSESFSQYRHSDTRTILTEVDQDSFGHTILSAIQISLQTQAGEDDINILLDNLIISINDGQRDHDALNRTSNKFCQTMINDLQDNIQYHDQQSISNIGLRDDTVAALAKSESDMRQNIKDIADNEATYAKEQNNRDQQHDNWFQKNNDHIVEIEAIDNAAKMMQHLQLGASFAQVKSRYDNVVKMLQTRTMHEQLFKVSQFNIYIFIQPIVSALAELSSQVDFKSIQKISSLLTELREQIAESKIMLKDSEDRQSTHWNEFSSHLTNEHNRLTDRKKSLEFTINEQKNTIQDTNEFIEYHNMEYEDAVQSLQTQIDWCEQQGINYEKQTESRISQLETVTKVQEHISEHIAATAQYLIDRKLS